jgi:membrane protease YdiL (CAAX protease family)
MDIIAANRYKIILTIGILLGFFYYPVIGHFVFLGRGYTTGTVLYSRLFIWLEVVILFVYAKWMEKGRYLLWPEKPYGFWFYPASLGALYLLTIGAGIVSTMPRWFGFHDNEAVVRQMISIVNKSTAMMIFGAITAGVTEELIFRGYLLPRLELIFKNKTAAVIVSAAMFAMIHYRYFSVGEIIFAFCIGVIFAIHYQWYRNIKILIATHAFIDFVLLSSISQ